MKWAIERFLTFEDLCFLEASFVPGGFLAPELYDPTGVVVAGTTVTGSSTFSLDVNTVPVSPFITPTFFKTNSLYMLGKYAYRDK